MTPLEIFERAQACFSEPSPHQAHCDGVIIAKRREDGVSLKCKCRTGWMTAEAVEAIERHEEEKRKR